MRKIALLLAAMMFLTGTAFGAATDATGSWIMTIPAQTTSVYAYQWQFTATVTTVLTTWPIAESTKTFDLDITDGVVTFTETGIVLNYYNITGTGTYTGTGPFVITGNMTSGSSITTEYGTAPVTVEMALPTFNLSADGQITDGTLFNLIYGLGWIEKSWTAVKVPVPAAFGLLAAGIIGLVALRRKNEK